MGSLLQIEHERKTLAKHFSRYLLQLRRSWQKSRQSSDDFGIRKLCQSVDTMASDLDSEKHGAALGMLEKSPVEYTSTGVQLQPLINFSVE